VGDKRYGANDAVIGRSRGTVKAGAVHIMGQSPGLGLCGYRAPIPCPGDDRPLCRNCVRIDEKNEYLKWRDIAS
jgi:hypothetical protein